MSFIDTLRSARNSHVAVLHEFWLQYDPLKHRVHAFFEEHDDIVFFAPHIERLLPTGFRLFRYRCEGKARVFDAFAAITAKVPDAKLVLFFVDKDLDDILGIPWPTDPRIFVTDAYSIENYVVTSAVLRRLYRDSVRLSGVSFDEELVLAQFETQLARFHRRMLSIMAWILVVRRGGGRPNLNNVRMAVICEVSETCDLGPAPRGRAEELSRSTSASLPRGSLVRLREASRELARIPAKRIIRGKFEIWFLVEFWRRLVAQLRELALEANGKVSIRIDVAHATVVPKLCGYVDTPRSLELFLRAHFSSGEIFAATGVTSIAPKRSWWARFTTALRR